MATQEEFNEHVQKIIDLKGKAIDLKNMRWVGLNGEEEAELKRLEATLPDILKDDREIFTKLTKKKSKKIKITIEIEVDPEDFNLKICEA